MSGPRIEFLPEHLIDQIKAGEVVERPANVLKELMENALDSGATSLDIEIIENGMELIRVQDNGSGIAGDQIEMAFGRHATSKIKSFQDLYALSTFGFRGEALPSIASISHIECASWTDQYPQGVSLKISGAIVESKHDVKKTNLEHGTIMSVRNLFYNTPARLKFLQSAQSEKNWIKKYFYSFVISRPDVSFSLAWDQTEKKLYPKVSSFEERIGQLFSSKAKVEILSAQKEWNGIDCKIFFIFTQNQRSEGPLQHVLINGRPVLEKSYQRISQQVLERAQLPTIPETMIILNVPGDIVDVNVHPNKTVVKFFKTNDILSLVSATMGEALPKKTISPVTPSLNIDFRNDPINFELKNRTDVYSEHRDALTQSSLFETQKDLSIIHQSSGPYLLISDPQFDYPFYISGKEMLEDWIKSQPAAERYPLLVSHPIKNVILSSNDLDWIRSRDFDIDRMKDLVVVREIPIWATNLPLNIVLAFILAELKKSTVADFNPQDISSHQWLKIYLETQSLENKKYKILLSPQLLFP